MSPVGRLLPTMLFVPGSSERFLAKARSLHVPAIILDLEDSVATQVKAAAREMVAGFLSETSELPTPRWVRVNGVSTGLFGDDLEAVVRPSLAGIVVPKVEDPDHVRVVSSMLDHLEAARGLEPGSVEMIATIETVRGLLGARAIASASPRLHCLGFGAGDFSADLGLPWLEADGRTPPPLTQARIEIVFASRAGGLAPPHDGAYPLFDDLQGLKARAEEAKLLGFLGKHAIHPRQVPVILQAFRPSDREVERSRQIVIDFEQSEASGIAAIAVGREMVDYPVAQRARSILELATQFATQAW